MPAAIAPWALVALLGLSTGCQLLVGFDRSRIDGGGGGADAGMDASMDAGPDAAAPCAADERVEGGACVRCGANATNAAGDDPSMGDTACTCDAGFFGDGTGDCTACTAIPDCASGLTCTDATDSTCATCADGFIGDGTDACTACEPGTFDDGDTCAACTPIPNCASGLDCSDATDSICGTCEPGFNGDGTAMCSTCPAGSFQDGDGCAVCTPIPDCASGLSCTGPSDSSCAVCAPGFVGDRSRTCTACGTGTFDRDDACVACGDITGCDVAETCNRVDGSARSCPDCAVGFFGDDTRSCTACSPITSCAAGLTCTSASDARCGTCAPGTVGDGGSTCIACGTGTFDRDDACVPCGDISGCAVPETCNVTDGSSLVCPTCSPGFGGDGTGTCTACTTGTFDSSGVCTDCGTIPNCALPETCNATNGSGLACPTCSSGFFGSGTATCAACTAIPSCASGLTCTTASNSVCATCAAGTVGDGTGTCTACGTGTFDSANVCTDCGTIANCSVPETCNATNGSGLACPTCSSGFFGSGTATCTACTAIPNCASGLTCTTASNSVCGTCAPGFSGSGTGTCSPSCGDGIVVAGETCDDGNANACGTCSADCQTVQTLATATGTLTFSGNLAAGDSITIGGVTYAFVTDLMGALANAVLIGSNIGQTIGHLVAAINGAAGEGTTYSVGTVANPAVTAADTSAGPTDRVTLTARAVGSAGNTIGTVEVTDSGDVMTFSGTTLAGGAGTTCALGVGCTSGSVCASGSCVSNVCAPAP